VKRGNQGHNLAAGENYSLIETYTFQERQTRHLENSKVFFSKSLPDDLGYDVLNDDRLLTAGTEKLGLYRSMSIEKEEK